MTGIVSLLANLIDAIDDLPSYPFRLDVKKASDYLENRSPASVDVAALYLRDLVVGARSVPGFLFGADLDACEAALKAYRPTLV
jgi:hypothetical protein